MKNWTSLQTVIYHLFYLHNIRVLLVLLLFTQLFTAVFTLVLELVNKELNFTAEVPIYLKWYLHNIWE